MRNRHMLFVFRTPPYSGNRAREGLDALLAAAAFEQQLSVLFMGDGVFQLFPGQSPANGRNQHKMLQSLQLYDVERVYFSSSALVDRNISASSIRIRGTLVTDTEISGIMASADHVFTF